MKRYNNQHLKYNIAYFGETTKIGIIPFLLTLLCRFYRQINKTIIF